MGSPQDWRDLRDLFLSIPASTSGIRPLAAVLYPPLRNEDPERNWYLENGTDTAKGPFARYARAGARLLGHPEIADQSEWREWLNSLRDEPLLSDFLTKWVELGDSAPPSPFGWEIENVCRASVEYCTFLASGAAQERRTAAASIDRTPMAHPYSRRAEWLNNALRAARISPNELSQKHRGPDRKTTAKILAGRPVSDGALDKLAIALTDAGHPVTVRNIPQD